YGAVAGKRVLVVDDDPDIRELLFTALEDEGFEVVPAGNGQEALAIIKTFRPDVIVLDLMMPVMDGWQFAHELRARDERDEDNQPVVIRLEHFVITSNVSVVAALVAFLVARAALGVGHYRALLIALGFACMAAIFAVHGLATPGVLEQGEREGPAQLVLGVSAELALAVAAVFFAVRYTPLAGWLE